MGDELQCSVRNPIRGFHEANNRHGERLRMGDTWQSDRRVTHRILLPLLLPGGHSVVDWHECDYLQRSAGPHLLYGRHTQLDEGTQVSKRHLSLTYLPPVPHHLRRVTRHVSYIHLSPITYPPAMCHLHTHHLSPVTLQMALVLCYLYTCHLPPATCHWEPGLHNGLSRSWMDESHSLLPKLCLHLSFFKTWVGRKDWNQLQKCERD